MCGPCWRYAIEIKKLHQLIQKIGQSSLSFFPESVKLTEQSCEQIELALGKVWQKTDLE